MYAYILIFYDNSYKGKEIEILFLHGDNEENGDDGDNNLSL